MASSAEIQPLVLPALQRALASSVSSGTFADTTYQLYSQRQRNGKIGKPRIVYGSSNVMKAVSAHLRMQLEKADSEKELLAETEAYDYDSDSDLDESEYERDMRDFEKQLSDSTESPDTSSPTWSDFDSMDTTSEPDSVAVQQSEKADESTPAVQSKYHVAANTWQALVHFVYTGQIHFSPLKSEGLEARRASRNTHLKENPDLLPLCSPKSVYRLAKMIGSGSLKTSAQEDLKAIMSLTSIFINGGVFSHEDILVMQLDILYRDAMLAQVMPQVTKAIAGICQGHMPYDKRVFTALLEKLSNLLTVP